MGKPRLCGILNVDVNEKFKISYLDDYSLTTDFNYWVNEYGRLLTDSPYGKSPYQEFNYADDEVVKIINDDYKIVRGE